MMQTASSSQLQATLQASTSQLIETAQLVKQQAEEKDAALDQAEKKNRDLNSLLAQQDATIKLLSKEKQEALEDAKAEKKRNEDMRRSAEDRYLETISSKERQIKQLSDEKQQAQTDLSEAEADKKLLQEKWEYAENLLNKERSEHNNKLSEGKKKLEEDLEKLSEEKKKVEEDLKTLQDECASQHGPKRRRRSRSRRRARGSRAQESEDSSDDHSDDSSDTCEEPSSELHPISRNKLKDLIHKSLQKSPEGKSSLSVLTQRVKERFNADRSVPPDDKALLNTKGFSIKSWVKGNCPEFGTRPDREDGRNDTIIFIKTGHHGGS